MQTAESKTNGIVIKPIKQNSKWLRRKCINSQTWSGLSSKLFFSIPLPRRVTLRKHQAKTNNSRNFPWRCLKKGLLKMRKINKRMSTFWLMALRNFFCCRAKSTPSLSNKSLPPRQYNSKRCLVEVWNLIRREFQSFRSSSAEKTLKAGDSEQDKLPLGKN